MLVINTPWSSLYNRACTNPHPEVTDTQVQCTFLKNYPQLLQSGEGNYKQNTTLSSVTAAHQVLRTTKNVLTTKGRVRVSCAMRPQCPSYCCAQAIVVPKLLFCRMIVQSIMYFSPSACMQVILRTVV